MILVAVVVVVVLMIIIIIVMIFATAAPPSAAVFYQIFSGVSALHHPDIILLPALYVRLDAVPAL
jgi:hypothetical protein